MRSNYKSLKLLIGLIGCLFPDYVIAQTQDWISFSAKFDDTRGVIDLHLSLKNTAPISAQPFLVMTAAKMNLASKDGQPTDAEMPVLAAFSDSVESVLRENGDYSHAGNFTRNGVRINYFYVTDTVRLRQEFVVMYAKYFPKYNLGLKLKYEEKWQTYFEFLYPGDEILETVRRGKEEKDKSRKK